MTFSFPWFVKPGCCWSEANKLALPHEPINILLILRTVYIHIHDFILSLKTISRLNINYKHSIHSNLCTVANSKTINISSTETRIKQAKKKKKRDQYTMTADALAPSVARSSAAMVLIMQERRVLALQEEGLQQPVPCVEKWLRIYIYIYRYVCL